MSTGLPSATGRLHCCRPPKSNCKRFCAFRLARGRREGSVNDGSSKHTYGGALFVKDQIIPGMYFYEWVRELSNIVYMICIYILRYSLEDGSYNYLLVHTGIVWERIFLAFHSCLFSLVAILIQEYSVLSLPTCLPSATG